MNDNQTPSTSGEGTPRPEEGHHSHGRRRRGFFRRRRPENQENGQHPSGEMPGHHDHDVDIIAADSRRDEDPALTPHIGDPEHADHASWDEMQERPIPYNPNNTRDAGQRRPVDTLKTYLDSKEKRDRRHYEQGRQPKVAATSWVNFWEGTGKKPTRIMPIGGLEEVGGNSMIIEYDRDIFVVDCGILFGGDDMPGVDFILPDLTYVEQNRDRFRGFVITHGHLDHIGALPHILPKLDFPPIYAPKLAIGLMKKHLEEAGLLKFAERNIHEYDETTPIVMGDFRIEGFRVDHSLPDCFGLYIQTPTAKFIHTGDFRMDSECLDEKRADLSKIAAIGDRGVDLLMADSTNALLPGWTPHEKDVVDNLEAAIAEAEGRVIITTFSTLVTRLQKIINIADKHGRKVYVNGRSMINNITLARDLGFIKFEPGAVKRVTKHMQGVPDNKVIIVTTGSQGETLAGLTRIANGSHPVLSIKESDLVIHSASMIPSNGMKFLKVVNMIARKGATIRFKLNNPTRYHTSGHGQQEDLKQMMQLTKPKHIMPLHGEYFMRQAQIRIGVDMMGIPKENAHLVENGDALELLDGQVRRIVSPLKLVDMVVEKGTVGQANDPVFQERLAMMENGVLVVMLKVDRRTRRLVSHPKIISRGFLFKSVAQERSKDLSDVVRKRYDRLLEKFSGQKKQKDMVYALRADLSRWILDKYEKSPIVMPIFIEQ